MRVAGLWRATNSGDELKKKSNYIFQTILRIYTGTNKLTRQFDTLGDELIFVSNLVAHRRDGRPSAVAHARDSEHSVRVVKSRPIQQINIPVSAQISLLLL